MRLASAPMARTRLVFASIATTLGSLMTMPRSRTWTSVFAVPRSIPMSREKRPRRRSSIGGQGSLRLAGDEDGWPAVSFRMRIVAARPCSVEVTGPRGIVRRGSARSIPVVRRPPAPGPTVWPTCLCAAARRMRPRLRSGRTTDAVSRPVRPRLRSLRASDAACRPVRPQLRPGLLPRDARSASRSNAIPRSRSETYTSWPTMRWSRSAMSSSRPAASASAVRWRSSGDGVGSPLGWL